MGRDRCLLELTLRNEEISFPPEYSEVVRDLEWRVDLLRMSEEERTFDVQLRDWSCTIALFILFEYFT